MDKNMQNEIAARAIWGARDNYAQQITASGQFLAVPKLDCLFSWASRRAMKNQDVGNSPYKP